jgi:murein DD-endopeptidase MepM/ murein hydrolase activator NlpD
LYKFLFFDLFWILDKISKMPKIIIQPGDTLSRIAQRQGTTVSELLQLNPKIAARDPMGNKIFAGETLNLPEKNLNKQVQSIQPSVQSSFQPSVQPVSVSPTTPTLTTDQINQIASKIRAGVPLEQAISDTTVQKSISPQPLNVQVSSTIPLSQIQTSLTGTQNFEDVQKTSQLQDQLKQYLSQAQKILTELEKPRTNLTEVLAEKRKELGIPQLEEEITKGIETLKGTEGDIRSEVEKAGGLATESQVQALAAQRQKLLLNRLDALKNALDIKNQYVNQIVKLTGQDRDDVETNLDRRFKINDQIIDTLREIESEQRKIEEARLKEAQTRQNEAQQLLQSQITSGGIVNLTPQRLQQLAIQAGYDIGDVQAIQKAVREKEKGITNVRTIVDDEGNATVFGLDKRNNPVVLGTLRGVGRPQREPVTEIQRSREIGALREAQIALRNASLTKGKITLDDYLKARSDYIHRVGDISKLNEFDRYFAPFLPSNVLKVIQTPKSTTSRQSSVDARIQKFIE